MKTNYHPASWGIVAAALWLATASPCVHAGAVYRCSGPGGQVAITNKPAEYSSCTKLPNTDYVDPPSVKAVKPAPPARPSPASAKADSLRSSAPAPAIAPPLAAASDSAQLAAAQSDSTNSNPARSEVGKSELVDSAMTNRSRSEYRSDAASPFANVVGGMSINGVAQKSPLVQNITEKVDKSTEVRRGAVYKVARANGITEYTNIRPAGSSYQLLFTYIATCYACNVHSAIDFATVALNLNAYRDEVASAAAEFGVDAALLRAVIHAESAFNPNAISNKGAQGLMQLMPATASDLGVVSPFDTAQNIRGGARYLGLLLRQFNGDERLATAAYNAGAQNVQKYSGVPPFDETKVYVERVATLRKRYGEAR